ncbi:glycosyltransferase [Paenibacillus sp. SYP-B3998]|uniref:Glycosyltransferase n=1 Tax=Paenibacillus sp. SYP-B3998 TaxID=2678564 RepID=A0A6G3ZQK9_9BACL|nr:glycosyltransferase [Paenibacillus sp. SYP-B3998]NEW04422.1 glycosyltransferase [Paenibacillus sp. SYP-B3998]
MRTNTVKRVKKKRVSVQSQPQLSVIIPAQNEAKSIGRVIYEAKKIARYTEVIVVCNGCKDQTERVAKKAGARVLSFTEPLGHDVGRAIGAQHARGPILLFLDADFAISHTILKKFYLAVRCGCDVALNAYSGYTTKTTMHSTSEAKRMLNRLLKRPDLLGSSLTSIPHAMTKEAASIIGIDNLCVPPLAQARAVLSGLQIKKAVHINVSRLNMRRKRKSNYVERMILADHAEAIAYVMKHDDTTYDSSFQIDEKPLANNVIIMSDIDRETRISLVFMVQNESEISAIQKQLSKVSFDKNKRISSAEKLFAFVDASGPLNARIHAAELAKGEIIVFVDGGKKISFKLLLALIDACERGADVAIPPIRPKPRKLMDLGLAWQASRYMNRMLGASQLGFASLLTLPHAFKTVAIHRIGPLHLSNPALAQVIALTQGLQLKVAKLPHGLFLSSSVMEEEWAFIAQLNALGYLQQQYGTRLFDPDLTRRREQIALNT